MTGVQTCALPISPLAGGSGSAGGSMPVDLVGSGDGLHSPSDG